MGTESGWHDGEAARFRVLVNVLAKLVSDPKAFSGEDAQREYQLVIRISRLETEIDRLSITFIAEAAAAFYGFETNPASELTRNHLSAALEALSRIPIIGPGFTDAGVASLLSCRDRIHATGSHPLQIPHVDRETGRPFGTCPEESEPNPFPANS